MNQKQITANNIAEKAGVKILNIEDYKNKDSELLCECMALHHKFKYSVEYLMLTGFECIECKRYDATHVKDFTPYFLALDAASYTTGMVLFNKEGQMLTHRAFTIDKRKDFFERAKILKEEIVKVIQENNIRCVILEDIQLQANPQLFKKLSMLHGILRYTIINELDIDLVTATPAEWRSFSHIRGAKREEQKQAAIRKANYIFGEEIGEDESEAIFLGYYGIDTYKKNNPV